MGTHVGSLRTWFVAAERFVGHAVLAAIGFVLMFVGLAMGVTMVMLPMGIAVGILGVLLFVAGLFAHIDDQS